MESVLELDLDLIEVLEVSLRCSLCLERCRSPRSLSCLHTFCLDCLIQLFQQCDESKSSIFPCPECRVVYYVPQQKGFRLPQPYAWKVLAEILDRFRSLALKGKQNYPYRGKNFTAQTSYLDYNMARAFKHMTLSLAIVTAVPNALSPRVTSLPVIPDDTMRESPQDVTSKCRSVIDNSTELRVNKMREFTLVYQPNGVSCTPNGNVIVCENAGDRTFIYGPDGAKVVELQVPKRSRNTDVGNSSDGRILVAEHSSKNILVFEADGSYVKSVGIEFDTDTGICVYGDEIFFTSAGSGAVYQMRLDGGDRRLLVKKNRDIDLDTPAFVTVSPERVAVSDWAKRVVFMFDRSGQLMFIYSGEGSSANSLAKPSGLAIDSAGRLIISDSENNCVHFVSSEGRFLGQVSLKQEGLYRPWGLSLNSKEELVIAMMSSQSIITIQYKEALLYL